MCRTQLCIVISISCVFRRGTTRYYNILYVSDLRPPRSLISWDIGASVHRCIAATTTEQQYLPHLLIYLSCLIVTYKIFAASACCLYLLNSLLRTDHGKTRASTDATTTASNHHVGSVSKEPWHSRRRLLSQTS